MPKVAPSAPFVDPSLLLCLRADYTCMYAQFEPGNEWNSSEADPELQTLVSSLSTGRSGVATS